MTMNLFDQFASPEMLYIPLTMLTLLIPPLLMVKQTRLMPNRTALAQTWLLLAFSKHLMAPLSGPGRAWASTLLTVMTFLLITNLLGLLPYTFTPTTQLSLNMGLAVPLWLTTLLVGVRYTPTPTLAHLLPLGTPTPLIPILIIIETISTIIRPLALGVRLTANLTAGHLLITLVSTAAISLLPLSPTTSALTFSLLLLLVGLEVAVAMIQAYVFVLLLSLYLQENT